MDLFIRKVKDYDENIFLGFNDLKIKTNDEFSYYNSLTKSICKVNNSDTFTIKSILESIDKPKLRSIYDILVISKINDENILFIELITTELVNNDVNLELNKLFINDNNLHLDENSNSLVYDFFSRIIIRNNFGRWIQFEHYDTKSEYSKSSRKNYVDATDYVEKEFNINIYNIDSYDQLCKNIDHLFANSKFKEDDVKGHNARSCGLKRYKEFFEWMYNIKPSAENNLDTALNSKFGDNTIVFGAPGCGKSYIIKTYLNDLHVPKENIFRVTFHPEYTNTDFVGQIIPIRKVTTNQITNDEVSYITYEFNPGPFTLALKKALETKDMVYLIIEEINRGNASAIFGDLFQLLDRNEDVTSSDYGSSEYPIKNVLIQQYLDISLDSDIYIPKNLCLIATMNSCDQNVFVLDTAFKRRWKFKQISNDIEKDKNHKYKSYFVPGTNVNWEQFLLKINNKIIESRLNSEDKRLGKYFISKAALTEKHTDIEYCREAAEIFAFKILEYIWDDVAKVDKDMWFNTSRYPTLEDLINGFLYPDKNRNETPLSIFTSIEFDGE